MGQRCLRVTLTFLGLAALLVAAGGTPKPKLVRVSVSSAGDQVSGASVRSTISRNGRFAAFSSNASTLVENDANATFDVFLHDRKKGDTTLASIASEGTQGDGNSDYPSMSTSGRLVAFDSSAANLVPDDDNLVQDIFVHDRKAGETTRVSVSTAGAEGDASSFAPSLSGSGRYVAFESSATNLVEGDTLGFEDVFVHDRKTGETTRVSVASDGSQANDFAYLPSLSASGRFVAFSSEATNLVDDDRNGVRDVFVHDRKTGETSRVSVASGGAEGELESDSPSISGNGRFVAFKSGSLDLGAADGFDGPFSVFVRDVKHGVTTLESFAADGVTQSFGNVGRSALSASGRWLLFHSDEADIVDGDSNSSTDAFMRDRKQGTTRRVSLGAADEEADAGISLEGVALSGSGRYAVFPSDSTNLVEDDSNGTLDVFLRDTK